MIRVYATPITLAVAGVIVIVIAQSGLSESQFRQYGVGLIAFGITVTFLLWLLGVRRADDFARLKTPRKAVTFHMAAAFTWLSFVPAEWANLRYAQSPEVSPEQSQAVVATISSIALVGLPFILLGVYLCTRTTTLPVPLWTAPFFSSFVGVGVLMALVCSVPVVIEGVLDNVFLVPSSVATVYLLLSGRAAAARAA